MTGLNNVKIPDWFIEFNLGPDWFIEFNLGPDWFVELVTDWTLLS